MNKIVNDFKGTIFLRLMLMIFLYFKKLLTYSSQLSLMQALPVNTVLKVSFQVFNLKYIYFSTYSESY